MAIIAEYIWIDVGGNLRSKCRTLIYRDFNDIEIDDLPLWNFDGSSTGQAIGSDSEVILAPKSVYRDPFREGANILVLCDCYDRNMTPIESNNRHKANIIFEQLIEEHPWFGLEQEYVMYNAKTNKPLGWPVDGEPEPQGKYYCGIGTGKVFGRHIVDEHYEKCLYAGINISGTNAEVMPGQWEFQVGPCEGIDSGDETWMARFILERVAEKYDVIISYEPKPVLGDWNGSGCHINFSSLEMRNEGGIEKIYEAINKLEKKHDEHIAVYGDNTVRLSGNHETSPIDKFTYGVADRTASIRIPSTTHNSGYGYLEDRRPASDIDPYLATAKLAKTTLLE